MTNGSVVFILSNLQQSYYQFSGRKTYYTHTITLLVPTTLIMKRAPVFPYRNFGIRCFQLKQNGGNYLERLDEEFIERLGT